MSTVYIGFVGSGNVAEESVKDNLNDFLPDDDTKLSLYIPDTVRRTNKGMMAVWNQLDKWKMSYRQLPDDQIVIALVDAHANGEKATLIVLLDDSTETEELAVTALKAGVPVKDLCSALDDMEWEPPEDEPAEAKTYGQPRTIPGEVISAEVSGPATIVSHAEPVKLQQLGLPVETVELIHQVGLVEGVIRSIVRQEVRSMGLGEFNPLPDLPAPPGDAGEDDKIKAWTNDEGDYKLPDPSRAKAPRGWKTVELSKTEAKRVGLF